ncbi:MAG: adenylate/guanylate cyclase domain-containing protein [Synechococcales bacterium]|nr:adenylate/guanylate cyclase domain-containing protein [Synechococcales bacterium]
MVTSQPTPHLLLRTDSGSKRLSLAGITCWTVGRSDDNTLVLIDRWISRNHAMLQSMENGEMYLIDLGSRNGSFVNGRRVSVPVPLRNGDRLTFGQTELEYYCPAIPIDAHDFAQRDLTATATLHVRRLISVLVIDIRDYTKLTRQLDEKILSEMIGTWFRQAGEIIRDQGSWVDKYIGDAVMAVWIHGTEDVPVGEMAAVFRSVDQLHRMTNELSRRFPVPFPLRIGAGINTGQAMVGNTGSGDRPDYTALGDTVNAAFRLESSTKELHQDVAFGESTYRYLSPLLQEKATLNPQLLSLLQHKTVQLKGYDQPTATYSCSFAQLEELLACL